MNGRSNLWVSLNDNHTQPFREVSAAEPPPVPHQSRGRHSRVRYLQILQVHQSHGYSQGFIGDEHQEGVRKSLEAWVRDLEINMNYFE